VTIAVDAMRAAERPHAFLGVTEQSLAAIVRTTGNKDVHILALDLIMIDCSHGNPSKNHNNQPIVLDDICEQIKAGERSIVGVMIGSHINAGRQDIPPEGPQGLKYGVSITDACINWAAMVPMLDKLNEAVKERRQNRLHAQLAAKIQE